MSYVSSSPGSINIGPHVYWSDIGSLAVDAHKQLWVNALIGNSIVGNQTMTNRVDVNGKPDVGTNVTNSSNASVNAQEAKIYVTKKANPRPAHPARASPSLCSSIILAALFCRMSSSATFFLPA